MTVGQLKTMLETMNDDYQIEFRIRPSKIILAENDADKRMVLEVFEIDDSALLKKYGVVMCPDPEKKP